MTTNEELEKIGDQILELYSNLPKRTMANREKFLADYQHVIPSLKKEIDGCLEVLEISEKIHNNSERHKKTKEKYLVHLSAFVQMKLFYIDMCVLYSSYIKSNDENEKQVFIKLIALNIYELFVDLPEFLGKKLKPVIEEWKQRRKFPEATKMELDQDLNSIRAFLNSIKELSWNDLKEIRHNVAAHKEKDIIKQVGILRKMNHSKIEILFFAATNLLNRLIDLERTYFSASESTV